MNRLDKSLKHLMNGNRRVPLLVVVWAVLALSLTGCEGQEAEKIESVGLPATAPASDKVITLAADEWLPYNGPPEAENPGFMIEIAKYAFERAGYKVEYLIVPWARAIRGARDGVYDGVVGGGVYEVPDFVFPENEQGLSVHTFYVKQGASWKFKNLDSLRQISLGVIRDYSYGTLYSDYIDQHENNRDRVQVVGGNEPLSNNIKKLLAGRIDALIEDRTVFQYHFHQTKTPNSFVEAGTYEEEKMYIAFSPTHKDGQVYAEILSRAMDNLRDSGKLATILEKYGVQDWKK